MSYGKGGFRKRSRTVIMIVLAVAIILFYYYRLMQLQIVNGDYYSALAQRSISSTTAIPAARGEILDRYGRPIAVNTTGYTICFQRNFMEYGEENRIILDLAQLLTSTGEEWNDSLPVTRTSPYAFEEGKEDSAEYLKEFLRLNGYASVENCLDALYERYGLSEEDYSEEEKRLIAGVRYEMELRGFNGSNDFVFSSDISVSTAAKIEELSYKYKGVAIGEALSRKYVSSSLAPHVVGVTGAMSAAEYETYKKLGYNMNDKVGKFGAEEAFEEYLKGTDGKRLIIQDNNGVVTSENDITEAVPGNSVVLTLDFKLQEKLQEIIDNHMVWLKEKNGMGKDVTAISMVVLDVSDGGVLAMAQNPSFDLNSYFTDYSSLITDEAMPLFNRACNGLYRPGSTFKTITSLAGLSEGQITGSSTITCRHVYDYYDDYQPTCLGTHGAINVKSALGVSCNVFFYELGRRLGITKVMEYASLCGYGQKTGIELDEASGRLATPETAAELGKQWYNGDVLQASIGQSDTAVTPLQMATLAMTLANNGTRYKTHILKEVKSFDLSETVYTYEKEVMETIEAGSEVFDAIKQGMIKSANGTGSGEIGLTDFKLVQAALKTGTPQVTETVTNHCILGYAPADDPQVAFAVMQEGGAYSAKIIREFLQYYFTEEPATSPEDYGTLLD